MGNYLEAEFSKTCLKIGLDGVDRFSGINYLRGRMEWGECKLRMQNADLRGLEFFTYFIGKAEKIDLGTQNLS